MDGLLVIDKPAGPTSHDVVARLRRVLRERRIGHTGTLDPFATGVLPLVIGRATRLAQFLSASRKTYEAVVALGFATDTGDATGARIAGDREAADQVPARDEVERALAGFRGTFLQQPPAFSAKKIGGRRSYEMARAAGADAAPRPNPVEVTVHRVDLMGMDDARVALRLDCSAGFYVRSLAHDLGERLGVGGHLAALRRTRSGDYGLDEAIGLEEAEGDPSAAADRLVPMGRMLPQLPAVSLTPGGIRRARQGQDLAPADCEQGNGDLFPVRPGALPGEGVEETPVPFFRLLDPTGDLVAVARPAAAGGLLHPFVVLG
jgi:tRNA pseudouridine55 synthase